jgi:predicted HNH restriction endonuclease
VNFHDSSSCRVYCSECSRESSREETSCVECGDKFEYYPSEKKGLYCETCVDEVDWNSRNLPSDVSGENNPNWKGGSNNSTIYTGKWNSVRRKCLKRDNHTCQNCGKNKKELGREPDVHHIIPVKTFEDEQDAHYIDNVICLCSSCHNKAEEGCIDDEKLLKKNRLYSLY